MPNGSSVPLSLSSTRLVVGRSAVPYSFVRNDCHISMLMLPAKSTRSARNGQPARDIRISSAVREASARSEAVAPVCVKARWYDVVRAWGFEGRPTGVPSRTAEAAGRTGRRARGHSPQQQHEHAVAGNEPSKHEESRSARPA
jgi:hypothetical protein